MTTALTVEQVAIGAACLLVLAWVWRAGARRARAAADGARAGARLLSLTGRVLFTAGVIVGVQWLCSPTRTRLGGLWSRRWGCPRCSLPTRSPAL
ncbi:hypothetical protein [Actinophytocola sp. KF-1]